MGAPGKVEQLEAKRRKEGTVHHRAFAFYCVCCIALQSQALVICFFVSKVKQGFWKQCFKPSSVEWHCILSFDFEAVLQAGSCQCFTWKNNTKDLLLNGTDTTDTLNEMD